MDGFEPVEGSAGAVPPPFPAQSKPRRSHSGKVRSLILDGLAAYDPVPTIIDTVSRETGVSIAYTAIRYYRERPKWQLAIETRRKALEAGLARIPISSRFWRQKTRQELVQEAREQPGRDLGTARQLLMDAAKEAGHLQEQAGIVAGTINVQVINAVMSMPVEALEAYARTGKLEAGTWSADVRAAAGVVKGGQTGASGESGMITYGSNTKSTAIEATTHPPASEAAAGNDATPTELKP